MGGYGSGKWSRSGEKIKTDTVPRIDIRLLRKRSLLRPGANGIIHFSCAGSTVGSLSYSVDEDYLLLGYGDGLSEDDQKPSVNIIWLSYTPCHFGGKRAWFRCPKCDSRVAILYLTSAWFRCRRCSRLTYQTQCWSELDRSAFAAYKIRRRLGASGSLGESFPPRPKGMHLKTYFRLMAKAMRAERRFWRLVADQIDGFLSVQDSEVLDKL